MNRITTAVLVMCGLSAIVGCDAEDARKEAERARQNVEEALQSAKEEAQRKGEAARRLAQEKLQIDEVRDRAEEAVKIAQDAQRVAEQRFSQIDEELRKHRAALAGLKAELERADNPSSAPTDKGP